MGKLFADQMERVKRQYPHIGDGWEVASMALNVDALHGTASDIQDRSSHLENEEGYFPEVALSTALSENVMQLDAPDGYMFVRLEKDGERPMLVLLDMEEKPAAAQGLFAAFQRFISSRLKSAAA